MSHRVLILAVVTVMATTAFGAEDLMPPPTLAGSSEVAVRLSFTEPTPATEIYRAVGETAGVEIVFDPRFSERQLTIDIDTPTTSAALDLVSAAAGDLWVATGQSQENPRHGPNPYGSEVCSQGRPSCVYPEDLFFDDTEPTGIARTPSGKIELMPAALLRELGGEEGARTLYVDVAGEEAAHDDEYPFRLIPYRVSTLASGTVALQRWLAEQPSIFPEVHWHPWVEVSPEPARELGFADGTSVWVVSRRGRYRARLKVFPGTAPENVCAPYRLPSTDGDAANPLHLLDGSSDPLTGLLSWHSTFIRLERA